MVARPPCLSGSATVEISGGEVELINEGIDHPNGMIIAAVSGCVAHLSQHFYARAVYSKLSTTDCRPYTT